MEPITDPKDHTAVIMCPGSTYCKDMEQAKALGAIGYLAKPPSFELLKDIILEHHPHLVPLLNSVVKL